ncbi:Cytochrome b-c1 complex subunit 9, mitochondrial [Diplodia seriata]|uniref:Complex III subunit 9 n=1 Tax=Diplodia intermedia TaxID=856260 RepID=A0ABR3TKR4_9PEZI
MSDATVERWEEEWAADGWDRSFDSASDKVWDSINRGRQWKDIKHKYVEGGDDE